MTGLKKYIIWWTKSTGLPIFFRVAGPGVHLCLTLVQKLLNASGAQDVILVQQFFLLLARYQAREKNFF